MFTFILYLLILFITYTNEGGSFKFWLLAIPGILFAVLVFITMLTTESPKEQEEKAMKNWTKYWAAGGPENDRVRRDDRLRLAPPPQAILDRRRREKAHDEALAMWCALDDD